MDLKESECGQIGVTTMHGTLGCTILAPAASEYAVLPVGVAMMIPERKCFDCYNESREQLAVIGQTRGT